MTILQGSENYISYPRFGSEQPLYIVRLFFLSHPSKFLSFSLSFSLSFPLSFSRSFVLSFSVFYS